MEDVQLSISGMSCGHCVGRVSRVLAALPGVRVDRVEVGRAAVGLDPARTPLATLLAALGEEGYEARAE